MNYTVMAAMIAMFIACTRVPGPNRIQVIAHRGASAYAPENTLAAFRKAVEMGADFFELDVYLSRDLAPVVIHDGSVRRTTGANGSVTDMTLEEIKLLDAGSRFDSVFVGEKIPTLGEALAFAQNRIKVYIEIKDTNPLLPEKVLQEIELLKMRDQVIIQSFSLPQLAKTRELSDWAILEYLTGNFSDMDLQKAVSVGARGINPSYTRLDAEQVTRIHRLGMRVTPYTIDDPAEIQRLIDIGVNGIITNKPDIALKLLSQ